MPQFKVNSPRRSDRLRLAIVFLLLAAPVCVAVWSVEWFMPQDGSAHLYTAHLLVELIKGNPVFAEHFALNPLYVPNSSGHWILAALLLFFAPAVVTKIFVAFSYLANVAAIVWLHAQVVGRRNIEIAALLAAIIALNGLWLWGFYNFNLGTALFALTIGLWWRWRADLTVRRLIFLSILFVAGYFSHLISFGMTAACVLFLAVFAANDKRQRVRNSLFAAAALVPIAPLIIGYKTLSRAGGGLVPHWQHLANPLSIADWARQLFNADPLVLLARQSLPFSAARSGAFLTLAPSAWFVAALACLSLTIFLARRRAAVFAEKSGALAVFGVLCAAAWIVAPDDFGKIHGAVLRERILLIGFICLVPILSAAPAMFAKRAAIWMLIYVWLFQSAVAFEYAQTQNRIVREYAAAKQALALEPTTLGSIFAAADVCRYKSAPLVNLNALLGVNSNIVVWDDYELGNYYFPVVARREADRSFIYDFSDANEFFLCDGKEFDEGKAAALDRILRGNHRRIETMLLWGAHPKIEAILQEYYEAAPFYQSENVRLFRHK